MSTTTAPAPPSTLPADYASLTEHYRPLFARIADGALDRELDRRLPFDEVKALDEAGFGTLRVPVEHGGPGVTIETFTRLLIDLAEADSNIAHLYRSHAGFLEVLRFQPRPHPGRLVPARPRRCAQWATRRRRRAATASAPSTQSCPGQPGAGPSAVRSSTRPRTIFSDYTRISAARDGRGRPLLRRRRDRCAGSHASRTTGTASVRSSPAPARPRSTQVAVEDTSVLDRVTGTVEAIHEAAFFQHVLLAVLAGIARASRRDAAATISSRKRTFNTGLGLPFREDPLIQEATGRIAGEGVRRRGDGPADRPRPRRGDRRRDRLRCGPPGLHRHRARGRPDIRDRRRARADHRPRTRPGCRAGPLPDGRRLRHVDVEGARPPLAQRADRRDPQSDRLPRPGDRRLLDQRHPPARGSTRSAMRRRDDHAARGPSP